MILRRLQGQVEKALAKVPCLVLTGPRQVGKTTLARAITTQLNADFLDLERPADLAALADPELYLSAQADRLVVLDEVQNAPGLFPALRVLIDRNRRPGRFLLLGSASPALLHASSESLAGRVRYLEATPLMLGELAERQDLAERHWVRGGFPEPLQEAEDREALLWQESFLSTYVRRDLPSLGLGTDPAQVQKLLQLLAAWHSQNLNMSDLARALGLSVPTVGRVIDFLESAYLVRRLPPFHANLGKRLVKTPKVYIRDSGMLHGLLGLATQAQLLRHPVAGPSFEGYVLEQILPTLPAGVQPYFFRTADGAELDLVLARGPEVVAAIEVKLSTAPSLSKGNHLAREYLGNPPLYIAAPVERRYPVAEGIEVMPIGQWTGMPS